MRRHRSWPRPAVRSISALAALAFVAAACGDDAEPTATPSGTAATATAGPTVAATITPTAPPDPTPAPTATPTARATATPETAAIIPSPIGDPQPAPELVDLVNPDGTPFELTELEGSNVLVFFGYTRCPDVCPTTLGEIYGVFDTTPETQAVFISVDPERDTPEFLEEWTEYLHQNLHAVTGSPGAIRRAADNYGVKYARVETTSTAGYTMSHTADIYLIDEHGQLLLAYPFGTPAAAIAADIAVLEAG